MYFLAERICYPWEHRAVHDDLGDRTVDLGPANQEHDNPVFALGKLRDLFYQSISTISSLPSRRRVRISSFVAVVLLYCLGFLKPVLKTGTFYAIKKL